MTNISADAIVALTNHQRQLDADGTEVGVSRQALDEVLAAITPPAQETVTEWECKDYADGWIRYATLADALDYQEQTGCIMRPVRAALSSKGS